MGFGADNDRMVGKLPAPGAEQSASGTHGRGLGATPPAAERPSASGPQRGGALTNGGTAGQDQTSESDLSGKRVLVVGLGRTGVAVARFLIGRGACVTVTDTRSASELGEAIAALRDHVTFELGGHVRSTFVAQDLIVVSPGVPEIPELAAARRAHVSITGEIELASHFVRAPIVAITGTNGKSTVTSLCGAMVERSGKPTFVGGNLGTPFIGAVGSPAAGENGVIVLEISSFQLETCDAFRPRVSALLNITPDHLDRYPSMEAYVAAKARIFMRQGPDDYAVVNMDDPLAWELATRASARVVPFSVRRRLDIGGWLEDDTLCLRLPDGSLEQYPGSVLRLVGLHNRANALAAALAARLVGTMPEHVLDAMRTFTPLSHRMELVRELHGVAYYDDSKGTNVAAVAASLDGFPRPVVLIAGGRDKGGDYAPLRRALLGRARGIVLIGEAAPKMEAALQGVAEIRRASSMEEAVATAASLAKPGDAVVLSPACSSFDMFRDYAHRAAVFREAVMRLGQ